MLVYFLRPLCLRIVLFYYWRCFYYTFSSAAKHFYWWRFFTRLSGLFPQVRKMLWTRKRRNILHRLLGSILVKFIVPTMCILKVSIVAFWRKVAWTCMPKSKKSFVMKKRIVNNCTENYILSNILYSTIICNYHLLDWATWLSWGYWHPIFWLF